MSMVMLQCHVSGSCNVSDECYSVMSVSHVMSMMMLQCHVSESCHVNDDVTVSCQ